MTSSTPEPPPAPTHVLETILYVEDMKKAREFYQENLCLKPFLEMDRGTGFALGNTTLLLFTLGLTTENIDIPGRGRIPWHGPTPEVLKLLKSPTQSPAEQQSLHQHFCLAVDTTEDVKRWEEWFKAKDVKVICTMDWEKGGRSVYFEDLDGHIGEVGSRGIWPHY